jgi:Kef-type K+ transport system membrane component KefB
MHSTHTDFNVAIVVGDIALVLLASSLAVMLVRRIRQPAVIGEILAGIVLGPSVLGLLPGHLTQHLFPAQARPVLAIVSQVGLLLFMFLVGWEFNGQLLRRSQASVPSVSLSAIALSFGLGFVLASEFYRHHAVVNGVHVPFMSFALYLGIAMSITAFPVLARIIMDTGLSGSELGALVLASAATDDVIAWCLLAVVVVGASTAAGTTLGWVFGCFVLYAIGMAFVVRPALRWVTGRLIRNGRVSPYLVPVVGAGIFLSAYVTSWIGVHVIFGAFAFGLCMPREPASLLQDRVREPFEQGNKLLLPIFFAITGLSVDITSFTADDVLELLLILVAACLGKLLGAGIPAKLSGLSWRDSYAVGLLMNTRGLTELVILNIGLSLGVLDRRLFTMMVLMALTTTAMASPLLPRYLRDRYLARVPDELPVAAGLDGQPRRPVPATTQP